MKLKGISQKGLLRIAGGAGQLYYHISNELFDSFDSGMGVGSQMWFGKTSPEESNQYLGAGLYPGKDKYLYTVRLSFTNPAGRDEYDRLLLDQIIAEGFDAIELDDSVIMFDEDLIEIVDVQKI